MLDSSQETNHIICKSIHLVEVENLLQVEVEVRELIISYQSFLETISSIVEVHCGLAQSQVRP